MLKTEFLTASTIPVPLLLMRSGGVASTLVKLQRSKFRLPSAGGTPPCPTESGMDVCGLHKDTFLDAPITFASPFGLASLLCRGQSSGEKPFHTWL